MSGSLGGRLAVLAALVAAGTLALAGPAVAAGVAGLLGISLGTARDSRIAVTLGGGALFLGVLIAGLVGAPPSVLLVAVAGAVVAWDLGENAISLTEQLGAEAETARADLAHALGSGGVAAGAALVGAVVFRLATGGQPLLALVLFLFGALVIATTLGP